MSRSDIRIMLFSAMVLGGLAASCETAPDGVAGAPGEPWMNEEATAMRGFSWVINEQVAGMPRPGSSRSLDQDLAFLRDEGVDVLVSLTETPTDPLALERFGIQGRHIPVLDFHAPTQAQLEEYVKDINLWTGAGRRVGTHCGAGLGRTGTFLAALFVARGMDSDSAIAHVRSLRPGSIETKDQEAAVREFADRHARLPQ